MTLDAKLSRRRFLSASASAAVAPMILGCATGKVRRKSPNERITIGFIGFGKRSRGFQKSKCSLS